MSENSQLWSLYSTISHWISSADIKATTILAFIGVLIGFLFSSSESIVNFLSITPWLKFVALLSIFALFLAIVFALECLLPILSIKERNNSKSLIYFKSIANYPPETFTTELKESLKNEVMFVDNLISQIHTNSKIATHKHLTVKYSLVSLVIAITLSSFIAATYFTGLFYD